MNVTVSYPDLIPLPIGVIPPSETCARYTNKVMSAYADKLKTPKRIQNLVYMNHINKNNYQERNQTDFLKTMPWITCSSRRDTPEQYLDNTYNHKFVISPPGRGIDCFRTWESMYLGTIPIVKRSFVTRSFQELPMLLIDDWHELSVEMLNDIYDKYQATTFDYRSMMFSYWAKQIIDAFNAMLML